MARAGKGFTQIVSDETGKLEGKVVRMVFNRMFYSYSDPRQEIIQQLRVTVLRVSHLQTSDSPPNSHRDHHLFPSMVGEKSIERCVARRLWNRYCDLVGLCIDVVILASGFNPSVDASAQPLAFGWTA